jgi:hypothetical protein
VEEDAKLTAGGNGTGNDWLRVAALASGRTNDQCCKIWAQIFNPDDKKNKRIESREIHDSDSGSSLEAYIEGIFVSSTEQMGIFGVQERSLIEQIA